MSEAETSNVRVMLHREALYDDTTLDEEQIDHDDEGVTRVRSIFLQIVCVCVCVCVQCCVGGPCKACGGCVFTVSNLSPWHHHALPSILRIRHALLACSVHQDTVTPAQTRQQLKKLAVTRFRKGEKAR